MDLDQEFKVFHTNNPAVYKTLVGLAREAVALGHKKIGIKMLWEVARWEIWIKTTSTDEFKLNNNFTSRYARLIMDIEPDLKGIFELRGLKS